MDSFEFRIGYGERPNFEEVPEMYKDDRRYDICMYHESDGFRFIYKPKEVCVDKKELLLL